MGVIRRYRTAWSRHHRSAGFGIHSPHAYRFVREVLRERNPYYAYQYIFTLRKEVLQTERKHAHPRVISLKNAKMLFRITNHFTPAHILQIGTSYGISATSMMEANSKARILLYEPHLNRFEVTERVLKPYAYAITVYDQLESAIAQYRQALKETDLPFVLVNDLPCDDDFGTLCELLFSLIATKAVIVMRNISRNARLKALWQECQQQATYGQTFTNEKIGVIVANPKLQREDFLLWF